MKKNFWTLDIILRVSTKFTEVLTVTQFFHLGTIYVLAIKLTNNTSYSINVHNSIYLPTYVSKYLPYLPASSFSLRKS